MQFSYGEPRHRVSREEKVSQVPRGDKARDTRATRDSRGTIMGKILNVKQAIKISKQLKRRGKTIVVAGGVFDILHIGHIKLLENARKWADFLFVLLESDASAKINKGPKRPINFQKDRAIILSAISFVDFVVLLPQMTTDREYDTLMAEILPDVIATTNHDPNVKHKERQAKKIGAKLRFVTRRIPDISSTRLAQLLEI